MLTKCPPLKHHLMIESFSVLCQRQVWGGKAKGKHFKEKQHGLDRPAVQLDHSHQIPNQQLGHSHQTLWRADESCSIQGSSEHKLFNTPSLRGHTNSLNISASHFYVWLPTKLDTEGDVTPHPPHFSSQVTPLAKSSVRRKQQGLRVKTTFSLKVLEAKRENILLNLPCLLPQTSYSLALATELFSVLTAHILQASKSSSSFWE